MVLPMFLMAGNPSVAMQKELGGILLDYAMRTFDLPEQDIQLRVHHWSNIPEKGWNNHSWSVERRSQSTDVGYQTLWLVARKGPLVQGEYPVSVEITVTTDALVTTKLVSRYVSCDKIPFRIQKTRISRDFRKIVRSTDELPNKITHQVIPAGRILTRDMFMDPPDVMKGDKVNLELHTGALVISTDGITTESATIGDKIRVYCTTTRIYLTGEVQNSNTVIIEAQ